MDDNLLKPFIIISIVAGFCGLVLSGWLAMVALIICVIALLYYAYLFNQPQKISSTPHSSHSKIFNNQYYSEILVKDIGPNEKNNLYQAELTQYMTTRYSREKPIETEIRTTRVDVPWECTKEQVELLLSKYPEARIQKIISKEIMDVLTTEQKNAIQEGARSIDDYKEAYILKDTEGTEKYMRYFFRRTQVEDVI